MLVGSNKRFIEETIPHIGTMMCGTLDDVLSHGDTVVLGHRSPEIEEALDRHRAGIRHLVDLAGTDAAGWTSYRGVCW
jgi:GDP-mannose 6-dehydrogenase